MNFSTLFEKNIETYCKGIFPNKNILICYLHIPKAAGNSSIKSVKQIKKKFHSIQWDNIDDSWSKMMKNHGLKKYELVSGHFHSRHLDLLKDNNINSYNITFIRHPIERIISDYRYNCTETSPKYKEFIKQFPSFEKYAINKIPANQISLILVGGANSFEEYLHKLKNKYHFIGLLEFFNLSMSILMDSLGNSYTPINKLNVTQNNKQNIIDLSHQTYKILEAKHSLDIQLFEYLFQNYTALSDTYIAELLKKKK